MKIQHSGDGSVTWIGPVEIDISLVISWKGSGTSPVQIQNTRAFLQRTIGALRDSRESTIYRLIAILPRERYWHIARGTPPLPERHRRRSFLPGRRERPLARGICPRPASIQQS